MRVESERCPHAPTRTPPTTLRRSLGVVGAAFMLACWNTSSSNLLIPYAYAQLGVALGPLLQVAIQGMGLLVALGLVEATVLTKAATTGELGEIMGGKWGRFLMELSQAGNNLLWLPCAIILMVDSAQVPLVGTWFSDCNIRLTLPFILLGFILVTNRRHDCNDVNHPTIETLHQPANPPSQHPTDPTTPTPQPAPSQHLTTLTPPTTTSGSVRAHLCQPSYGDRRDR